MMMTIQRILKHYTAVCGYTVIRGGAATDEADKRPRASDTISGLVLRWNPICEVWAWSFNGESRAYGSLAAATRDKTIVTNELMLLVQDTPTPLIHTSTEK